jgi:hypothetical protein
VKNTIIKVNYTIQLPVGRPPPQRTQLHDSSAAAVFIISHKVRYHLNSCGYTKIQEKLRTKTPDVKGARHQHLYLYRVCRGVGQGHGMVQRWDIHVLAAVIASLGVLPFHSIMGSCCFVKSLLMIFANPMEISSLSVEFKYLVSS